MKKPDFKSCTEEELWKFVGFHLSKAGVESVLVAQNQPVDWYKIEKWCEAEGAKGVYEDFVKKTKK